jgi:hypothetical protein
VIAQGVAHHELQSTLCSAITKQQLRACRVAYVRCECILPPLPKLKILALPRLACAQKNAEACQNIVPPTSCSATGCSAAAQQATPHQILSHHEKFSEPNRYYLIMRGSMNPKSHTTRPAAVCPVAGPCR